MGYNQKHILIVDDNESIHKDIESILAGYAPEEDSDLADMEHELFGEDTEEALQAHIPLHIDHAYQGEEAIKLIEKAEQEGRTYSLIYMDVRMPPGMDGIETLKCIKERFSLPEIVICTAFSDYSKEQIKSFLGGLEKLNFMSKPFDIAAVKKTVSGVA